MPVLAGTATATPMPASGVADTTGDAYWHSVVRTGDTLNAIPLTHFVPPRLWRELAALNRLPAQRDMLLPRQVLKVPTAWLRPQAVGANVVSFSGQVTWWPAGSAAQPVQLANPLPDLPMGESVQTGPNSSALLRFADPSTAVVKSQCLQVLDRTPVVGLGSTAWPAAFTCSKGWASRSGHILRKPCWLWRKGKRCTRRHCAQRRLPPRHRTRPPCPHRLRRPWWSTT